MTRAETHVTRRPVRLPAWATAVIVALLLTSGVVAGAPTSMAAEAQGGTMVNERGALFTPARAGAVEPAIPSPTRASLPPRGYEITPALLASLKQRADLPVPLGTDADTSLAAGTVTPFAPT